MSENTQSGYVSLLKQLIDVREAPFYQKVGIGLILLGFLLPFGFSALTLLTLTGALYFAIFAMSWDTASGYTGQFSFGHSFLFAVGGYTSGILNLSFGFPPLLAVVIAVVVTMIAGFLFGAPALRLKGPYFSVITFLLPIALLKVFVLFNGIFGGQMGLSNPQPIVSAASFNLDTVVNYYLALVAFTAILVVLLVITRSNAGNVFTGIREDEIAVAAAGINPTKFKLFAFVLSAGVAGLGGALFVHSNVGQPQPGQLVALTVSVDVILASILGGTGTITGAAIGGVTYYTLSSGLNQIQWTIPVANAPLSQYSLVIFSVMVLLVIYYIPNGILPWIITRTERLLSDRGRHASTVGDSSDTSRSSGEASTDTDAQNNE